MVGRGSGMINHGIYRAAKAGRVQLKTNSQKREPISILCVMPFNGRSTHVKLCDK